MAYHIKTTSVLNPSIGDVYYKSDDTWTDVYANRKVYSTEEEALVDKNTTVTKNGVTYVPKHWKNATIVSE